MNIQGMWEYMLFKDSDNGKENGNYYMKEQNSVYIRVIIGNKGISHIGIL